MPVPQQVQLVNRTTGPLDAIYDGQPIVLVPGYKVVDGEVVGAGPGGEPAVNYLPTWAAEMCKRQHPVMGTEDPEAVNDNEWLCGCAAWGDDISPMEQSDAPERLDRGLMDDEAATARPIRSRSAKRRGRKAGRKFSDPRLKNPVGIRADIAE